MCVGVGEGPTAYAIPRHEARTVPGDDTAFVSCRARAPWGPRGPDGLYDLRDHRAASAVWGLAALGHRVIYRLYMLYNIAYILFIS